MSSSSMPRAARSWTACVPPAPDRVRAAQRARSKSPAPMHRPMSSSGCGRRSAASIAAEMAEVDRVLRPDGRLLVVHDYGRDDVSHLLGDRPEYGAWSHRSGPFLTGGFRVRVVHCFWEFASLEDAGAFLGAAFGAAGSEVAATLKRPRLSWNVAIYHRTRP